MTLLSRYAKFIAALIGVATEALNVGLIPTSAQHWVTIAISALTALGVVGVTNGPSVAHVQLAAKVAALEQAVAIPKAHAGIAPLVIPAEPSDDPLADLGKLIA